MGGKIFEANSKVWIEIIIIQKLINEKNIKRKERDKKKIIFFLFNGGLGDWWSMSFGLFLSHWKYFIRLTHTRLSWLWDPQRKINFYSKDYRTQKYIHKERHWWSICLSVYFIRNGNWIEIKCNTYKCLDWKLKKKKKLTFNLNH